MDPDQGYWIWVWEDSLSKGKGVGLLVQRGKRIHLFWCQNGTLHVEGGSEFIRTQLLDLVVEQSAQISHRIEPHLKLQLRSSFGSTNRPSRIFVASASSRTKSVLLSKLFSAKKKKKCFSNKFEPGAAQSFSIFYEKLTIKIRLTKSS